MNHLEGAWQPGSKVTEGLGKVSTMFVPLSG